MKKIAFLGDSITEGCGASEIDRRYTTVLCRDIGAVELNYGIGGTRIAPYIGEGGNPAFAEYFALRAKKIDLSADFLFVFGGTNDYGHGNAPFGKSVDTDPHTFCGALRGLTEYLTDKFGREKICFILPLHRYDENNEYGDGYPNSKRPILQVYKDQIARCAESFGIDRLSLDKEFPEPKTIPSELTADGLHPNDKGHAILAEHLKLYLKNKGVV